MEPYMERSPCVDYVRREKLWISIVICAHFLEATAIRLAAEELYANTNSCTSVSTVE